MSRLPTSLHWLIEKRGRIDGSIQKMERYLEKHRRQFEKYQELDNELSILKETLASVDMALKLHDLKIDPQNIPTIYGKNCVLGLAHGDLTRLVCERLRGQQLPISSSEIVDYILDNQRRAGRPPMTRVLLARKVHACLKRLCANKKVVRHHEPKTTRCGLWTLSED